jgi:hypothetical protein
MAFGREALAKEVFSYYLNLHNHERLLLDCCKASEETVMEDIQEILGGVYFPCHSRQIDLLSR